MPQYAFIVNYRAEAPQTPELIPINVRVSYVDTDTNSASEAMVPFNVPAGANAAQIQADAAVAVRAYGATHGFANLQQNAVIGPQLARG